MIQFRLAVGAAITLCFLCAGCRKGYRPPRIPPSEMAQVRETGVDPADKTSVCGCTEITVIDGVATRRRQGRSPRTFKIAPGNRTLGVVFTKETRRDRIGVENRSISFIAEPGKAYSVIGFVEKEIDYLGWKRVSVYVQDEQTGMGVRED